MKVTLWRGRAPIFSLTLARGSDSDLSPEYFFEGGSRLDVEEALAEKWKKEVREELERQPSEFVKHGGFKVDAVYAEKVEER